MADIYTSSVNVAGTLFTDFVTNEVVPVLFDSTTLAQSVRDFDASGSNSKTFSVPVLTSIGAPSVVGETSDLSATAWTATNVDFSPVHYGKQAIIPSYAEMLSVVPLAQQILFSGAKEFAIQIDTDLAALFTGLSVIGNGASTMGLTFFLSALYKLEGLNVLSEKRTYLSPKQIHDLRSKVLAVNATAGGWDAKYSIVGAIRPDGYAGSLFGLDIYQLSNGVITASGATYYGGMQGIGIDSPIGIATWIPFQVEPQRDSSRFADEINMRSVFGVQVLSATRGVAIISK